MYGVRRREVELGTRDMRLRLLLVPLLTLLTTRRSICYCLVPVVWSVCPTGVLGNKIFAVTDKS
jgi:hypothetical protein